MDKLDQLFQAGQRQVSGRLVVDVPSRISRRLIAPALPGLLHRHPRLRLVLRSPTDTGRSAMHRRSPGEKCRGSISPTMVAPTASRCPAVWW